MTGYLELHGNGGGVYYINAKYVSGFYKGKEDLYGGKTLVTMSSGASYVVNESVDEIKVMIDKI